MSHTPPRLYVADSLRAGSELWLQDKPAHYLLQVLRVTVGGTLLLFNGRDGEWLAEIVETGKKKLRLHLQRQTRQQQVEPGPRLLFAPIKFGRIDYLVEKAVELGAAQLQPVRTARTIVRRINRDRLQAHAVEAAEQSERLTVPEVAVLQSLEQVLARWDKDEVLYYGDETGQGAPAKEIFGSAAAGRVSLLVGPEGGFSPEELGLLRKHQATVPVSLGPRVLRADTAALALLTCYQALAGDWRQGRPDFLSQATGEAL